MSRLVVAALVLLITMAGLVGAAAWNRSGDVQSITLTEKEVRLPWSGWRYEWKGDEPALRLGLNWFSRDDPQDARLWLTDAKLQEIGFATGVPAGAPDAREFYGRSLPRVAWVAFEFNGPAWRQIEQRLQMQRKDNTIGPEYQSRLVPVDAGLDREALFRRYASSPVLILQAVIGIRYSDDATRGPSVWGTVEGLAVDEVSVPLALRGPFKPLRSQNPTPFAPPFPPPLPRYSVTLGAGALGPFLQSVSIDLAELVH